MYSALSELAGRLALVQGRRASLLGACPWLLYSAPLALPIRAARRLPLATIFRAFGAAQIEFR